MHQLGQRALPQRAEPAQREEQDMGGAVASALGGVLVLQAVHDPHEAGQLFAEDADAGVPLDAGVADAHAESSRLGC
jgi:hypothetical protein